MSKKKWAIVRALPFHRWILESLEAELEERGEEYRVFEHRPVHDHDWVSGLGGWPVRAAVREYAPDMLVVADYPYAFWREVAPRAVLVGTRHSLAARGNTWEADHAEADRVVTWSAWDESLFQKRAVKICPLRAGCLWLNPLPWQGGGGVLWMPTWNPNFRQEERVIPALPKGVRGVMRPHAATAWREPQVLRWAKSEGWRIDLGGSPWEALSKADLVITDVSGSVFLAAAAFVPRVLQMEPWVKEGAQYDPLGPEWTFREEMGPTTLSGRDDLPLEIEAILSRPEDGLQERRQWVLDHMIEGWARGERGRQAAARVIDALEAR